MHKIILSTLFIGFAVATSTSTAQAGEISAEQCQAIRAGAMNMAETNVLFQRAAFDLTKASISIVAQIEPLTEFEVDAKAIMDGALEEAKAHSNTKTLGAMVTALNAACGKP